MADGRATIPSDTLKRAAVDSFRNYDPYATDSSAEGESETERLERYPAKRRPSPRRNAQRMRNQLQQAQLRSSNKRALKAEMEDECRGTRALRSRRRVEVAKEPKLEVMPKVLPEGDGVEDEDEKPGSGQVFLDGEQAKRSWKATITSRRKVVKPVDSSRLPKSDMGFFALLPGELRNRIYRFALVEGGNDPFLVSMDKETCNLGACVHMRMSTAVPGILSTCKQIRAEAMPIFAAENSFKFDDELVKARCVANWLRAIGPYANLIDKVVLDVVCWGVPPTATLVQFLSNEKTVSHFDMTLRWGTVMGNAAWTLKMSPAIIKKAEAESCRLDKYVDTLNREMWTTGKVKEEALLEFVWSDWLAKLVWICRK